MPTVIFPWKKKWFQEKQEEEHGRMQRKRTSIFKESFLAICGREYRYLSTETPWASSWGECLATERLNSPPVEQELWEPLFNAQCPKDEDAATITDEMLLPFLNHKITKLQLRNFQSISNKVPTHFLPPPPPRFVLLTIRSYLFFNLGLCLDS